MDKLSLFKYLQRTKGISRRDFFDMIKRGLVSINNQQINDITHQLSINDEIKISFPNGENFFETVTRFPLIDSKIIIFNKPKGYVVSKADKHNKTIFDILPKSWEKDFYYIGRLDKDSNGLLLLTNDPSLVDYYENPKNRILKIYEVKIDKMLRSGDIIKFKKGVNVDEEGNKVYLEENPDAQYETLKFYDIHKVQTTKQGELLRIVLTEGKKRHIRRALKSQGYKTLELKRIKVGKYELGDIKPGKYRIYKA